MRAPRSLFTFQQPQQPIYAAVMCFASVLFIFMDYTLRGALASMIKNGKAGNQSSFTWGVLAFLGLAAHALIPLQSDILDVILKKKNSVGNSQPEVDRQSMIHQVTE